MEDSPEDVAAIFITQSSENDASAELKGKTGYFNYFGHFFYPLTDCFSFFILKQHRFKRPITSFECKKFEKSWVSDASRRK